MAAASQPGAEPPSLLSAKLPTTTAPPLLQIMRDPVMLATGQT
jgi:hypothetical protein